ncbi:MAG: DNA recombination protein RmuC [Saprospiraceae bacterium]
MTDSNILYLLLALIIGAIIAWLLAKAKNASSLQTNKEQALQRFNELEKEFVGYRATSTAQMQTANERLAASVDEVGKLKELIQDEASKLLSMNKMVSSSDAELRAANRTIADKNQELEALKEEIKTIKNEFASVNQLLATARAHNEALNNTLQTQKDEMEAMGKKFNLEFENIANKILENKSEKFTALNKENLNSILEPLGKNISEFKSKVDEVYQLESKERFSLGERVKELSALNQVISEETKNLTRALKGESKTQGRWGEMILESILEKSGLIKGREYFMEHELMNEDGKAMKSESEGKKMRPDAVIKYPDNRSVIIDAKVSLNAFTRYIEATDPDEQKMELKAHITAIKSHIMALSAKGYDDYDNALDFVMLFIPIEPAYNEALKGDPELWHFAYEKRILLLSPTNLIISLKLIVDLWKREYQNQNAKAIAERGAKLYDKFVSFIENLEGVGKSIDGAKSKYDDAFKQLSTGNDNLIVQATKLRQLGIKNKKKLSQEKESTAIGDILDSETDESQLIQIEDLDTHSDEN